MADLVQFLSSGLVGTTIGIAGIIIALSLYWRSQIGGVIAYQRDGDIIVGDTDEPFDPIEISFEKRQVPRVSGSEVIIWNRGKRTIRGNDIVTEDPLRIEFPADTRALRVSLIKTSRDVNKFVAGLNSDAPHIVNIHFDYLDPGDGAYIRVLHTGSDYLAPIKGTIRAVPIFQDCGIIQRLPTVDGRSLDARIGRFMRSGYATLLAAFISVFGFVGTFLAEERLLRPLLAIIGIGYSWIAYGSWRRRRRYPLSLADVVSTSTLKANAETN